jgi:Aminomethyltransferase folate-binding domain
MIMMLSRKLGRVSGKGGTGITATSRRTMAAAAAASDESLVKTALNGLHKELGGDMVPFAGYELPVLYKGTENGGVMKEHLWCRADGKAALFDVSHMGQVRAIASVFVCTRVCVCGPRRR